MVASVHTPDFSHLPILIFNQASLLQTYGGPRSALSFLDNAILIQKLNSGRWVEEEDDGSPDAAGGGAGLMHSLRGNRGNGPALYCPCVNFCAVSEKSSIGV